MTYCQTSKRGATSKRQTRHVRCPPERHRAAMSHQPRLDLLKNSRIDCDRQNCRPILKAERGWSTLGCLPLMIGNLEDRTAKRGKTSIDFVERVLHQSVTQSPLPVIVLGGMNTFDPNKSGSQLKCDKQLRKTYLLDGGVGLFNAKEPTENLLTAVKNKTTCKFRRCVSNKCSNEKLIGWLIWFGCCINKMNLTKLNGQVCDPGHMGKHMLMCIVKGRNLMGRLLPHLLSLLRKGEKCLPRNVICCDVA